MKPTFIYLAVPLLALVAGWASGPAGETVKTTDPSAGHKNDRETVVTGTRRERFATDENMQRYLNVLNALPREEMLAELTGSTNPSVTVTSVSGAVSRRRKRASSSPRRNWNASGAVGDEWWGMIRGHSFSASQAFFPPARLLPS